jgi:glycosyltransferase involved in cell wall biosynthesis
VETIYLSTVTPVYRGARYLPDMVRALAAVRDEISKSPMPVELIESIFVDDAAVDDSAAVLTGLQREYPWVRLVHLSRNFGQHGATVAGILHSSGDWVATMDEDLQHHPSHLMPLLLHAVRDHTDIVYGASQGAVHRSAFRNVSSKTFKTGMSWLAGNPVVRAFSSFRMMRGTVARAACSVSSHDTYFDVVLSWFTNRVRSLPLPMIDVRSVEGGRSGYSLAGLLKHGRKMLISSEIKPLRFAAVIGLAAVGASVLVAIWIVVLKLGFARLIDVRGWASLMIAISFFGGLTAFLVGVALEYISTLVLHTLGKPTFFVVDRSKDDLLEPFLRATD